MPPIDELAERIERLVLRHQEAQRTLALLREQLALTQAERDGLRQRLSLARSRLDALLSRLPSGELQALAAGPAAPAQGPGHEPELGPGARASRLLRQRGGAVAPAVDEPPVPPPVSASGADSGQEGN